jgi:hypothetical protein
MIEETPVQPIPAIAGCRRFGLQIRSVIPGRHPLFAGESAATLPDQNQATMNIGIEFAALHHEGN